jgi:two-component system, OmpR family, sensor histidine kinase SenX3
LIRRLVPRLSLALGLGLGCIALAWGLFYLHGIFVEERDDALAEVAARRRALEQYAQKELGDRLHRQLGEARATIDAAAEDPLIPAGEMWLWDRGQQLLPRMRRSGTGTDAPATTLHDMLRSGASGLLSERAEAEDPGSPWAERLRLYEQLKRALGARDRPAIETAVRSILAHRAGYLIAVTRDIPFVVAMLEELGEKASPRRELLEALLRTGLVSGDARLEGMQRLLLRQRDRFSARDTAFLRERISLLCEAHHILWADFAARVDEPPGELLEMPADLHEPMLLEDGHWYVEPASEARVYGVVANVGAQLDEITSSMRERGMLAGDEEVRGGPRARSAAVAGLGLDIVSPRWERAAAEALGRYRLKAALEVVIAALVFGVMALGVVTYRRRHRFLELKSDFVSAVSHELRTPLASIRLMAETLERRLDGTPKARDYPTRILRDIDALSFLVENILSFNRLSRGRWVPRRERMKFAALFDKLDAERDLWARRPAELERHGVDGVEAVVDPDLMQLLFTNLFRNACQYNERDPARIDVTAVEADAALVIAVRDNGVGIPQGDRERVFDDFYRASQSSAERGSGLGLAICRKIVEAHGGTIAVFATSPEGTTFELRFPVGR